MANAKIDFTAGDILFSVEGEESWIANQLDKIIEKATGSIKTAPSPQAITKSTGTTTKHKTVKKATAITTQALPSFLIEKHATRDQTMKFLATALWLQVNGRIRLVTSDIIQALRDGNQNGLGNASRELANNVSSGFIDRDGRQFFVTKQGKDSLE